MLQIKQFTFSPIAENTYVLYNDASEACIIDPGCYFPEEDAQLAGFIEKQGLRVKKLLNTHAHLDHVFGLKWAAAQYNLIPHLHPLEKSVLERGQWAAEMYNLPYPQYEGPLLPLTDGDTLSLGNDELEVIFAPGHSPGHVCFYCKKQGFLIGGDVLFLRSIGRTDLPGGNHAQLIESIKTRLLPLPDATIVHSGHGPATTIGEEKKHNPYLQ